MKVFEIGTGYTSIPAQMGAATEIVVEELGKVFEEEKIDYTIFDIQDENRKQTDLNIVEVKVPKIFRKKDVNLGIKHKIKRVIYSINLAKTLKKEIKHTNDNIAIHFHNQYNMYFFLKLIPKKYLRNVKLYYTVHSYIWNGEWDKILNVINKRYFQEVECVKKADKVFVLNNITKEHFIKHLGIKESKIIVTINGVNTDVYRPLSQDKNSDITLFQCGSVCERKNQLGAIKALTEFLKEDKSHKYLYAGGIIDQEYKNSIDNYIIENEIENQVIYAGELKPGEELNNYYNKGKAFIFPSKAEAFSLVILEAMASGLPVIMDRKNILEISSDIRNALLFYNNNDELNKTLREKIVDNVERKNISEKSRQLVLDKFSWKIVANKYLEEFEENIKNKE